jgi:Sulfotransferase domain/N-terminal domain of galactosyltransferase
VHSPKIVFCTTCKGRTFHLKETLPKNIKDNEDYPNCSFLVLDYNSQDDLLPFLLVERWHDIDSGKLSVYSYKENVPFHISHAKNMAYRCAILGGADILVMMDADNYTGPGLATFVAERVKEGTFLCPNFPHIYSLPYGPGRPRRGYAGRLAIRSQDLIKMGGYDEAYDTWRGEDMDLISRLCRLGYKMDHFDNKNLEVIQHSEFIRFKEYPHAKQYEDDNVSELAKIAEREDTIVNWGKWGLGTVYKNSTEEINLKPLPTRIFGVGMQRTGTSSLDAAFKILGFDSLHWGTIEPRLIWEEMNIKGRSSILERFYSLCDNPIPPLFRKLDKAYPGSKFILTLRDEEAWLESVKDLWDYSKNPARHLWDIYPFSNKMHKVLYGRRDFDAQIFLASYKQHNEDVVEYFKDRPQDLLILDLDAPDKWTSLCQFLDVPIPSVPYPFKSHMIPKDVLAEEIVCESAKAFVAWAAGGSGYSC